MSFVNEEVSEQDIEKYGLRTVNRQFLVGDFEYEWTIDRERDIYLRRMGFNWQEPQERKISFYWKGDLLQFNLRADIEAASQSAIKRKFVWSLSAYNTSGAIYLPAHLEAHRAEVVGDLKAALLISMNRGESSVSDGYLVEFRF